MGDSVGSVKKERKKEREGGGVLVSLFVHLPLETNPQQDPFHRHVNEGIVIVQRARHRLKG